MSSGIRVGLAIVAAFTLMVLGWQPVTRDGAALLACVVAAAAVVGTGILARALRFGSGAAVLLQAVAVVACAAAVVVVPLGLEGLTALRGVWADGLRAIQTGIAPLAPELGVTLALVVFTAVLAFLTDLLAVTLLRPAYALLPLLGLFLVPALGLPGPVDFHHVIRFGVGLALILVASSPHLDDRRRGVRAAAWGSAVAVVVVALALSSVAGSFVPVAATRPFGQDQLQMTNPSLDLKRNLTQATAVPVLTYTTDRPTGAYLKMATLTAFDAGGFALDAVRVSTGRLPEVVGLTGQGTPRTTRVKVGGFGSEWLPVPYAPTEVRAPGTWGYATETLDVMAMSRPDRRTATRDLEYVVGSVDVRPSADQVRAAGSTGPAGRAQVTAVPQQLPARIRTLAQTVTGTAPTAGAKALALEAYLRSGRFVYSTAQTEGDSMRTLEDFLFGSRRGYCEQFAGAMVAMARVVGIPARMAVGFTPGTYDGATWTVSSHDMHTWPEIWLDGWGWVAFEPTPSSGVPTATTEPPAAQPQPGVTAQASPSAEPSNEPSDQPENAAPTPTPEADASATPTTGPDAGVLVGGALAILVALMAAAGPGVLRARRRASRLAEGQTPRAATLAAWDELRDAASDLGVEWPSGSPRYAEEELSAGLPHGAARALRAVALAAEQAMYDRPDAYAGPGSWATTVRTVEDALRAPVSRLARARATWWPRSLWRR